MAFTFDTNSIGSTFGGFGSMVWSSVSNSSFRTNGAQTNIRKIYGDTSTSGNVATNMNWARINYEMYPYVVNAADIGIIPPPPSTNPATSVPVPKGLSYADYLGYWSGIVHYDTVNDQYSYANSLKTFFDVSNSVNSAKKVNYMILGKIPASFLMTKGSGSNTYQQLNTANRNDYVNYLAAGLKRFTQLNPTFNAAIELVNEPDYTIGNGQYVAPSDYQYIVSTLRTVLNNNSILNGDNSPILIVGGGVSHLDDTDLYVNYLSGLSPASINSTHIYLWHQTVNNEGGQQYVQTKFTSWKNALTNKNLPIFATEFNETATKFHAKQWPTSNDILTAPYPTTDYPVTSNPNSADSLSYGARIYFNAISLISLGVSVPFYWQLNDVQWGGSNASPYGTGGTAMIDINGNLTNSYYALKPLLEMIKSGSKAVLATTTQGNGSNDIYEVVFVDTSVAGQTTVTVCMANCVASGLGTSQSKIRTTILKNINPSYTNVTYSALKYTGTYKSSNPPAINSMPSANVLTTVANLAIVRSGANWNFGVTLNTDETLTVKMVFN